MALPPGIEGYVAAQQQGQQQQMAQLQAIQGLIGLQSALAEQPYKLEMLKAQTAEHQAKVKKMQNDAAMNAQLAGLLGGANPDQLDMLGTHLAINGHPGAATVMNIADKRRALMQNQQAITGMQRSPGVTPATPNDDEGNPMPSVPAQPGIMSPLMQSPYSGVAQSAAALQGQIDNGAPGLTPQQIQSHLERLTQMHQTSANQAATQAALDNRQNNRAADRIDFRVQFPPQPRASGRPNVGGDASGDLTKEAIEDLARQSLYDPKVLVGFNRDTRTRKLIQNEATRIARESGATSEDIVSGHAGFKADGASLNKLTPQYDAIVAFEKTAIRNGDRLVQLADRVDSTGIPVIEQWIRAGRKATGDPLVSQFDAQLQVYRTEAAKILTNPNLAGQLTDSARHEVEGFLRGGSSASQIRGVVDLLKSDFGARKGTLEEQISTIRQRMRGRMVGQESEAAAGVAGAAPPAPTVTRKKYNPVTGKIE